MDTRDCWEFLAEVNVGVVVAVGCVWMVFLQLALEEEKMRLRQDQVEERALLGLREGGGRERGEALRFLAGLWWSLAVKMKQPRWRRRMKRERNLLKNTDPMVFAIDRQIQGA